MSGNNTLTHSPSSSSKGTTPEHRIDLRRPRYDQSTYLGRLKHFLNVTDMRTLLTSEARIAEARRVLSQYESEGVLPSGGEEALWGAAKIRDTCLHPDTGLTIPAPLRISAYVPANVIIAGGMLLPGAGLANQVFWQWVNQSYNVALNHANRNASNPVENSSLAATYAAAVTTSVGVAVGLTRGAASARLTPRARSLLLAQVPFVAVALSNIVNVGLVRRNEMTQGIHVTKEDGTPVGQSAKAGQRAAMSVATIRIMSAMPLMTLVPLVLGSLATRPLFLSRPWLLKGPVNLTLVGLALQLGLPLASALFPQRVGVSVTSLEPEFQRLTDDKGAPVGTLYFNRGL